MSCGIQAAGTIDLYFYGELPLGERAAIQEHLGGCGECRQALEDLSVIRAALAVRSDVATPSGGDWSAFMARLSGAITRAAGTEAEAQGGPSGRVLAMPFRRRMAPYLATAAVLALVTLSVLVVVRERGAGRAAGDAPGAVRPVADAPRPDAALVSLSGRHFERSKLVVLGLATKDAGQDDWAYERGLAETLLRDTRLYRLAAAERGMQSLADVMRDLELVLLQASMSEQPDEASLKQLQRLIRRRDLLTKMDVVHAGGL